MSFITVYLHLTWPTKDRTPFLHSPLIRQLMWKHIQENADSIGIHLTSVSGFSDHCHCLVSMDSITTIADVARRLKGESSHWINQQNLLDEHFSWQHGFYASSISFSHLNMVNRYILNQEEHHKQNPDDDDFILKESQPF